MLEIELSQLLGLWFLRIIRIYYNPNTTLITIDLRINNVI